MLWAAEYMKLAARNPVTYVPTALLDGVRRDGLYSGEALLRKPELAAQIAKARGMSHDEFVGSVNKALTGFKPDSARGVNVMFARPDRTKLVDEHPLNKLDLTPIEIRMWELQADHPDLRVHGQELEPYAQYVKRWTPEQLEAEQDDPSIRHHDLTPDELSAYLAKSPRKLWATYSDPDRKGMYAPDVPHAALITRDGNIPAKYLKIPSSR